MNEGSHYVDGFCEAVVIVRAAAPHLTCWLEVGGWELRQQGMIDPRLLEGWGLPNASGEEWLLAHPACTTGHVRLLRLENAGVQADIRPDDQCWDTGGIFDLNVRVLDLAAKSSALRALSWHGPATPVRWDSGGLIVKEWLPRGPDNVRLALIERLQPPLAGFDHLRDFSQVFNSSQIVRDLDVSTRFYCDVLGFKRCLNFQTAAFPPGANVFGLPSVVSSGVGLNLNIVHPQGTMEGSIEIVTTPGAVGVDLSANAAPPNFGMAALRFPVKGLDDFARHLYQSAWPLAMPIVSLQLAPYGQVRMLSIRSPDGAWLEFFETA